jgi:hypothetical protein
MEVTETGASATPQPEPVIAPELKPLEMEEFVHKQYEATLAAAESEQEPTQAPEVTPAAEAEAKPEGPTVTTQTQEPPFTEAELADSAFLGRLDAEGWRKLETYSPSLYKAAKAVARAQGTVYELKRQLEARVNTNPEPEKPEEPKTDPYVEALEKTDSLDPAERAAGFRTLARLEAQRLLNEIGIDPVETQVSAAERAAYRLAVQEMPELADLPDAELDAAVEADTELMDDVKFAVSLEPQARTVLLAKVMRRAGRIVISNRAAAKTAADADAARKAKETADADAQKRLRSNQTNASTEVVTTPGGKTPKGEKTIEESIHEKVSALKIA